MRCGLPRKRIRISYAPDERGDPVKRTMRWVGVGLVYFLCLGVAGVQAQQPVSAEPQAPSRTVQTPPEVVPMLPVPRLVKFAGTLKDELGKSRTGVVGVTFAIYKEQEGGAALWLETQNVELDEQGRYTVLLGSTKNEGLPLELFTAGEPRWLGVQVHLPKEVEQPRVLLVSVPYALKAADAETLGGKPLSSFVLASPSSGGGAGVGAVVSPAGGGAVGAATIGGGGSPNVVTKFDGTGANVINSSISDDGSRITVGEGINFNSDFSFVGNAEPARTGRVQMFDRANVGFVIRGLNVLMETLQGSSFVPTEVMRWTQAGNAGIVKISGGGNALVFPDGTVMTSAGAGTNGGTITGVTAGTGLTGGGTAGGVTLNIASGGITNTLLGANSVTNANIADGSLSPAKISGGGFATLGANNFLGNQGVVAMAGGSTGLSVQTTDLATANTAINGLADGVGGTGVIGEAENGNLAIGVWGISSSGVAGQFSGNVNVTGSLSKAGGSFKIDHPVDPANKYLYHSFVESPDMKNIYDGVTNLDAQGEAVVQLPAWFGVLNKEFRYQLTCIGGFAPVYIAEEISENRFKIAGGKPGMKVSWMVTGIRQDAWANAHRIPVEEEKPAIERGYYLHPELYGQPPQKSTEWATHPEIVKRTSQSPAKSAEPQR